MTITLATNTFGKYTRQNIAVDSYVHLRSIFPELKLLNVQFEDEKDFFSDYYDDLETIFTLKKSSKSICTNAEKKVPVFFEIIENAFEHTNSDYVIFVNSDVILLRKLIDSILEQSPDCMAGHRLEIENIDNFSVVLENKVVPIRVEIAGYDYFVFKKEWFYEYKNILKSELFIGKPHFDVVYAGLMVMFGGKYIIDNDYPMCALHIFHGNSAVTHECPERTHNVQITKNNPIFLVATHMMHYNLQYNLCRRKPWGAFIQQTENEREFQKSFFDVMNLRSENPIHFID